MSNNNIKKEDIEEIVVTGIGSNKIKIEKFKSPLKIVDEFNAIAKGGLYLSNKKEALIVSIGTGTAFIRATEKEIKHLGGTGVGSGTLTNLCKLFTGINSFEKIINLSKKGDLSKVDLRIADATNKKISTLPQDLTLANFGKTSIKAKKEDIVLGIINMIFEVIGMMAAFSLKNDEIKEVVLIGTIAKIPEVKQILNKIEKTQGVSFYIPENTEFAVAIGAIKALY